MKKQFTFMIIGILTIGVLVGLFFWISSMPKKSESESSTSSSESSINIVNSDAESIKNIQVKNQISEYNIKIENQDQTLTYSIDKLDESQAISKSEVDSTINILCKLNATRLVQENVEDLSIFGLAEPLGSIKITFSDETEKTLYIGDVAPLNAGVYLKIDEENTVYLIDTQSSKVFFNSYSSYIDNSELENEIEDEDVIE